MSLYKNWVLPRLLDLAMRNRVLDSYRRERSSERMVWFLKSASVPA
jgi:hypothetical protein